MPAALPAAVSVAVLPAVPVVSAGGPANLGAHPDNVTLDPDTPVERE